MVHLATWPFNPFHSSLQGVWAGLKIKHDTHLELLEPRAEHWWTHLFVSVPLVVSPWLVVVGHWLDSRKDSYMVTLWSERAFCWKPGHSGTHMEFPILPISNEQIFVVLWVSHDSTKDEDSWKVKDTKSSSRGYPFGKLVFGYFYHISSCPHAYWPKICGLHTSPLWMVINELS